MGYTRSESPITSAKIVVAGGFGVGKTTFVFAGLATAVIICAVLIVPPVALDKNGALVRFGRLSSTP